MTPGEFKEFAQTMKEYGISHLKMKNVEIHMGQDRLKVKTATESADDVENVGSTPSPAASPEEDNIIKHKVEQLESLMKLSDMELVNELFPESDPNLENDEIA